MSGVTANVSVSGYPLGPHTWRVSGGEGCHDGPKSSVLSLSVCDDTEFVCDTGACVNIQKRYQNHKYVWIMHF